jgi:cytochrome bd-type quinol oxidase subunit 2
MKKYEAKKKMYDFTVVTGGFVGVTLIGLVFGRENVGAGCGMLFGVGLAKGVKWLI